MLLRDLLAVPELQLRLLYGDAEALDRPVRWVYTTDLLDPARYLSGGELVVTGLMWRRSPADSAAFVGAVAGSGATALAAGDALLGCVPDDLLDACRRAGLPLLEVPTDVSFAALTERVLASVTGDRGVRLAATLARQRRLLAAVAEGRSLSELAGQVSTETGLVCRVLTGSGRPVVPGPGLLGPADLDRVTRTFLQAHRLPAVTPDRTVAPFSVFPVGATLGRRVTAWFLAVEGAWSEWDDDAREAVEQLASIAALDRARREEGLRSARGVAQDVLALVEAGTGAGSETRARLRQAGLDPSGRLVVAVAAFPGRPDLGELTCSLLDDVAAHLGPPVVAAGRDGEAVALVPVGDEGLFEVLRVALGRLGPGLGPVPLTVGVSAAAPAPALSGALDEARYARRLAELGSGPVRLVTAEEVTSHVLLLATVPDDVRRTFATRVLGPVLDYDAAHAAGLRQTLAAFLDCSGSWTRTAHMLHLHVNTVRYRIARVEQLTGRDLSRLEDRVDVFLALRSLSAEVPVSGVPVGGVTVGGAPPTPAPPAGRRRE